jgi:hypothetical protein
MPELARAAELHHKLKLRKFSGFQRIKQPESTGRGGWQCAGFQLPHDPQL